MRDFVSLQANPSDEVSTRNDFLIIADSTSTVMEQFANAPVSLLLDMHNYGLLPGGSNMILP